MNYNEIRDVLIKNKRSVSRMCPDYGFGDLVVCGWDKEYDRPSCAHYEHEQKSDSHHEALYIDVRNEKQRDDDRRATDWFIVFGCK